MSPELWGCLLRKNKIKQPKSTSNKITELQHLVLLPYLRKKKGKNSESGYESGRTGLGKQGGENKSCGRKGEEVPHHLYSLFLLHRQITPLYLCQRQHPMRPHPFRHTLAVFVHFCCSWYSSTGLGSSSFCPPSAPYSNCFPILLQ